MKHYRGGAFGKILAFFLAVVSFALTLASTLSVGFLVERDAYQTSKDRLLKDFTERFLATQIKFVLRDTLNEVDPGDLLETNYYYLVRDPATGEELARTYHGEETSFHIQAARTFAAYVLPEENGKEKVVRWEMDGEIFLREGAWNLDETIPETRTLEVTLWAKKDPVVQDRLFLFTHLLDLGYALRFWFFVFMGFFGLLTLACLIFLYWAAGRRPGEEKPVCGPFDRIPFDLYALFFALVLLTEYLILKELSLATWFFLYRAALLYAVAVADFMLFLVFSVSVAIRIKTRTLWSNTLAWRLLRFLGRGVRFLFRYVPLVWKAALGGTVLLLFQLFVGLYARNEVVLILLFLEVLVAAPFLLYYAIQLRRLQKAGERIAKGDLESRVDTHGMTPHLKEHGETLNAIGEGLSRAVEEKLRSERFKTELITNVSHDIKTPLTSIVNYVDLLQKCDLPDEKAREYLEVLARQSGRLKKLVVDLVEASKASSGAIRVEWVPCRMNILLQQALGEYEEKFAAAGLTPVLDLPEEEVTVRADSRLLWRVFDNLMNNVAKYAQEGTRVYLSVAREGNEARAMFRNVSRAQLNITGEELMERFVRGDSSRNTEGSGLGLSIARSLAELQGGKLDLSVDGDLFKVILTFPCWDPEKDGEIDTEKDDDVED